MNGDILLLLPNIVLNVAFLPTLWKKEHTVWPPQAALYMVCLLSSVWGYSINGQLAPAASLYVGAWLWFAMFIKSYRAARAVREAKRAAAQAAVDAGLITMDAARPYIGRGYPAEGK